MTHSTTEEYDTDTGADNEYDEVEDTDADDLDVDVDPDADDDAEDEVEAPAEGEAKPKKEKQRSRGDLPEGLVTPVGLAKILTERGLGGKTDDGDNKVVPPQVVYSYINNAPADSQYPGQTVRDSIGAERRNVCEIEAGVAWWEAKNRRAAARKANAAEKAKKAAEKAAKAAEGAQPSEAAAEASGPVEEAE
jgi:hypothetical protein